MKSSGLRYLIVVYLLVFFMPAAMAGTFTVGAILGFTLDKNGKLVLKKVSEEQVDGQLDVVTNVANGLGSGEWSLAPVGSNSFWLVMHDNPLNVPGDTVIGGQITLLPPASGVQETVAEDEGAGSSGGEGDDEGDKEKKKVGDREKKKEDGDAAVTPPAVTPPNTNFNAFQAAITSADSEGHSFQGVTPGVMMTPEVLEQLNKLLQNVNTQNSVQLQEEPMHFLASQELGEATAITGDHTAQLVAVTGGVNLVLGSNDEQAEPAAGSPQVTVQVLTAGQYQQDWIDRQGYFTQLFHEIKNCCTRFSGWSGLNRFVTGGGSDKPKGDGDSESGMGASDKKKDLPLFTGDEKTTSAMMALLAVLFEVTVNKHEIGTGSSMVQ